jgi:hypothetical protein
MPIVILSNSTLQPLYYARRSSRSKLSENLPWSPLYPAGTERIWSDTVTYKPFSFTGWLLAGPLTIVVLNAAAPSVFV